MFKKKTECECNKKGTASEMCTSGDCTCDQENGRCTCSPNVVGDKCDKCAPNHTNMQSGIGCVECDCDEIGTLEQTFCNTVGFWLFLFELFSKYS